MTRSGCIAVFALAGPLLAGCYSYRSTGEPTPGMDVRARLTAEAAVRRSQGLDEPTLYYDGRVVGTTPDTLTLDVLVARSSSQFQDVEIRDTVRLGTAEIQSILGRKLSTAKTVLVMVGAGAAAVAIVTGISSIVGGTGPDDGNPPPPARVPVPVLRWLEVLLRPIVHHPNP
jgi:hypothetical protein